MTRGLTTSMLLFAGAALAQIVPWSDQTPPIASRQLGDPAIVTTPGAQAVIATDTLVGGAWAWRLPVDGGAQDLNVGPTRGADFRRFQRLGDFTVIPAASTGVMHSFHPDAGADGGPTQLFELSDPAFIFGAPTALALGQKLGPDSEPQAVMYATDSSNYVQEFSLSVDTQGRLGGALGARIQLFYSAEGLVTDDRHSVLYAAAPTGGLFAVDELTAVVSTLDSNTTSSGNLKGQPAGLAFYPLQDGGGLLLAAVPAHDDIAVYAITSPTTASYVGRFAVGFDGGLMVRSSHFIDVTAYPIAGFPRGLLVIADQLGGPNYKLVPWDAVAAAAGLPVEVLSFDAGPKPVDGGTDGGADGGTDGGAGGGAGDGGGTHIGPSAPSEDPVPPKCGCVGSPAAILIPGALLLLVRFPRRRRTT